MSTSAMSKQTGSSHSSLLRALPAVDELLRMESIAERSAGLPAPLIVAALRRALADVRASVVKGEADAAAAHVRTLAERAALDEIAALRRSLLHRVVNATGVVLHTNLGRAPLSERAVKAVHAVARGYSNLEYDIATGRRGLRDVHGETLLTTLTGAEAALIVNNNAAAVLLVLSALAREREVILSRGEMIEIGGAFRIPEVMEQSGCVLREVGTTNRTHLRDYEAALNEHTGAMLKVHPSNYKLIGFTAEVEAPRLAELARRHDVPLIEDLGSGVLVSTDPYGLATEPTVQSRIAAGVDVVTFSGDKLLGGPQAGIIVGRKQFVDACRRHPLARALRVDKMTLAALQATLLDYMEDAHDEIPIYDMMGATVSSLRARAEALRDRVEAAQRAQRTQRAQGAAERTAEHKSSVHVYVADTEATVGGGSLPGETLPSVAVALSSSRFRPDRIATMLRLGQPPIVGRVDGEAVLLDLRTVAPEDDDVLAEALKRFVRNGFAPH